MRNYVFTGLLILLVPWLAACKGSIGDAGAWAEGEENPPVRMRDANAIPAVCDPVAPEYAMPRLTGAEYRATIADLLGPVDVDWNLYPSDGTTRGTSSLSSGEAEGLLNLGEAIASRAAADPAALLGCSPSDATCVRQFLEAFLRRAFRRDISEATVDEFASLWSEFSSAENPVLALETVMTAILIDPHMLYRPELTSSTGDGLDIKISGFELASRLSFFLWGTTPDDALLDAAASGRLDTVEGLRVETERLLLSDRAEWGMRSLIDSWFGLRHFRLTATDHPDPDGLRDSLRESLTRGMLEVFESGTFRDLHLSTGIWVDARLAEHLDLPSPAEAWERREQPEQRSGLLTHPAFLALGAAGSDDGRAIHRALLTYSSVLCVDFAGPPADAAQADTVRTEDPNCMGCHTLIDPLGAAFVGYDNDGRGDVAALRETGGFLYGTDVEGEFSGLEELSFRIADSNTAMLCASEHLLEHGLGRRATDEELCQARDMADALSEGVSMKELMLEVVLSHGFRHRGPEPVEEGS